MKKSHIVLLLDSVSFAEATLVKNEKVKVVGVLDKTKGIGYDAQTNPNLTTFHVIDQQGECREVQLTDKQGRPMGLEQSETVTLEGSMGDDQVFHANFMLMKCPSKYNEQKHSLSAGPWPHLYGTNHISQRTYRAGFHRKSIGDPELHLRHFQ
jgi:cytochrome c-type biogenesis protein CcmE